MSERKYDRLANAFMLVVIGSALLFDSGKVSHILAGSIGGVAAAASVILYFGSQRRIEGQKAAEAKEIEAKVHMNVAMSSETVSTIESIQPGDFWTVRFGDQIEKMAIRSFKSESVRSAYLMHHAIYHASLQHVATGDVWYGNALMNESHYEAQLSANEVAACAVEIIRNLSVGDGQDRWEFTFGADGLRVSVKKNHSNRPKDVQVDLDFGEMPTTLLQ